MIVGITGGIGSGKSTVAKIFATLGVPVYDADSATKQLYQTNEALQKKLKKYFGENVYKNKELDRKYLASIVFNNKEKLQLLNSIVHPYSIRDSKEWSTTRTEKYVIKEAALLFESESFHYVDYIIGVTAPETLRIHRVMQRDGVSREEVKSRMNNQIDDSIKMKLCDAVIYNDEKQLLIPQVLAMHQKILNLVN